MLFLTVYVRNIEGIEINACRLNIKSDFFITLLTFINN